MMNVDVHDDGAGVYGNNDDNGDNDNDFLG